MDDISSHIGLARNGQPNTFVELRPKRQWCRLWVELERSDELRSRLEEADLDLMDDDTRWGGYRILLATGDVKKHEALLTELLRRAYEASA